MQVEEALGKAERFGSNENGDAQCICERCEMARVTRTLAEEVRRLRAKEASAEAERTASRRSA
jgi:hypothetical protein